MVYFSDILYRLNRPLEKSKSDDILMIWPCKVLRNFTEAQVSPRRDAYDCAKELL